MQFHRVMAAAFALAAATVSAQTLKPGLWEISSKMQGGAAGGQMNQAMADMQKQMAAMPPDQRKMVEEMMAKQGMRMAPGGGGMNVQVCMSKEMVERNEVVMDRSDCKVTNHSRSGSVTKASFSCTSPPATGETQVTIASAEAYSSRTTVKTTVDGKPETMNIDASGKWLSANCGNLRPPGQK